MDRFNVESSNRSYEDGRSRKSQENQKKIDNRHLWLHPNQEMDNGPQGPSNREIDGQKVTAKAQSIDQSNKRYDILYNELREKISNWSGEFNLEDYKRFRESRRQQK
jgi:hypothetical protein